MLRQFRKRRDCGGLKGQLLLIAQGNALGGRYALIKVSRSVRATSFMRGNAPLHCKLRALRVAFLRIGAKMPIVLLIAQPTRGDAPGWEQQLGLQPASIIFQFYFSKLSEPEPIICPSAKMWEV